MPTDRDPGPQLSGRLMYLLKRARLELEELHDKHLGPDGVDGRQLGVLLLLDGREPESQQQAARRLGIDRTTMVGVIDALEEGGWVVRRPDPADRRRNVVELTDAGRAELKRAKRASDAAERELLAPLGSADAKKLRALLAAIAVDAAADEER